MKYGETTLGQVEAVINQMGGFENWVRFAGGAGRIVFDMILAFLYTTKIAAQDAITTSMEYFEEAAVKSVGSNFEAQFLGLEVPAVAESNLAVRKLTKDSLDALIVAELGDKAEMAVSQFQAFLAANRESSEWFICYLRGKDGNLWAVHADWRANLGGWSVGAYSVGYPVRWHAGRQVLSQA